LAAGGGDGVAAWWRFVGGVTVDFIVVVAFALLSLSLSLIAFWDLVGTCP
jgi:hypothetical protein